MENDHPAAPELEPREPTVEDLRDLCRELNRRAAFYVVVGGWAMRAAGYNRLTMDVDLLVASDETNEAKVFSALATLPDNAVRDLTRIFHRPPCTKLGTLISTAIYRGMGDSGSAVGFRQCV